VVCPAAEKPTGLFLSPARKAAMFNLSCAPEGGLALHLGRWRMPNQNYTALLRRLIGSLAMPASSFDEIQPHALTFAIPHAKARLCACVSLAGR
jgi:hypothetical protein